MPFSTARLFRAVVLAALSLHVFVMFGLARAIQGTFGFDLATFAIAAAFAFIMLIPLVWAVTLPELPEMYTKHVRPRRRYAKQFCPSCAYPMPKNPAMAEQTMRCTECGHELRPPQPYTINARTVRLFVMLNLLAWVIGITAGELWAQTDERAFTHEAAAHAQSNPDAPQYTRSRRWPGGAMTLSEPYRGTSNER